MAYSGVTRGPHLHHCRMTPPPRPGFGGLSWERILRLCRLLSEGASAWPRAQRQRWNLQLGWPLLTLSQGDPCASSRASSAGSPKPLRPRSPPRPALPASPPVPGARLQNKAAPAAPAPRTCRVLRVGAYSTERPAESGEMRDVSDPPPPESRLRFPGQPGTLGSFMKSFLKLNHREIPARSEEIILTPFLGPSCKSTAEYVLKFPF